MSHDIRLEPKMLGDSPRIYPYNASSINNKILNRCTLRTLNECIDVYKYYHTQTLHTNL